ncbi:MAG TPA: hypothetical protein DCW95_01300 [Chryseobacterium sp.]|nr:hypothetical protein [Chryseobacterium sp.]
MKRYIIIFFLLIAVASSGQEKEMMEAIKSKQLDIAAELGKSLLLKNPNSFETNFLLARLCNEQMNFNQALSYIKSAEQLAKADWQKSWAFVESIPALCGLRRFADAKNAYDSARSLKGTTNSANEVKYWGILLGFDEMYKSWQIREEKDIIFYFQEGISQEEIEGIIISRQHAFKAINTFFRSELPHKIQFFVWNQLDSYNQHLNKTLGFTKPEFLISHNKLNQSPGHEIAHNISYWKSNKGRRTRFINEGIAVYFDQTPHNKLQAARNAYKINPVTIEKLWTNGEGVDASILYPIAGAFVEHLINKDKNKFLLLVQDQTFDNAKKLYGTEIEYAIKEFTELLRQH